MLQIPLKQAWRRLWRNRLYTLLNLGGLTVGLAAAILILLWVQNERSFDQYHGQAAQTYRVTNTLQMSDEPWVWSKSPLELGEAAQKRVPGVERVARFKKPWQPLVFRVRNELRTEEAAAFVDSTWFEAFDYNFRVGNPATVLADINSVVLTETRARTWFGSTEAAVGKLVRLDSTDLVVRGVIGDNPTHSSFRFEVLLPIAASLRDANTRRNDRDWGNFHYQLFLQLTPGTPPAAVGPQLTRLYQEFKKDSTITASLLPLREVHFATGFQSDDLPKGNRRTVRTLGLVGLLVLVIASINYVNLATALASQRAKEVGLKKIIGAGRGRLFGQFLGESILLTFLALVVALGLVAVALPSFNAFTEKQFTLDFGNRTLWLILLGSTGLTVLLAGGYPALLLSSLQPLQVLRGGNVLGAQNAYFRQGLVVVQFMISIVLIVSTLVIYRQLRYVQTQDPGYQREHVFTFQLPFSLGEQQGAVSDFLRERLRTQSGVRGVTSANLSIVDLRSRHSGSLKWAGKPDDFDPTVTQFSVEPETQSFFGLKLTAGRWFDHSMKLDTANVLLNETAVRTLGLKPPVVGQWFEFHGRRGQIIGVVRDFHFNSFHQKIEPMVLFNAPWQRRQFFVKTTGTGASRVLAEAENAWRVRLPDVPFRYQFLDDQFNQLYQAEQQAGVLFNVFSAIAVLISCLGLFGLATFTAEQRTKEIGVRKVLGASVFSLVALLSRDFLKLVLLALLLAAPVAWYAMSKWLQDFAYRIDIEWWVLAAAGVLAVGIALLTVSFQAIKAALMNPVKSLRSE
jgi:ABC-type antimicrobial peptide transport system permease subunit